MNNEKVTVDRITAIMKTLEDMKLSACAEGQCRIGNRRYFSDGVTRFAATRMAKQPETYPFTSGRRDSEESRFLLLPFTSLASLEKVMRELREFTLPFGTDVVVFKDALNERCYPVLILRDSSIRSDTWKIVYGIGNVKSRIHRTIMMIELGAACK